MRRPIGEEMSAPEHVPTVAEVLETAPSRGEPGFADVLAGISGVDGWLTDDQARVLHERVRSLGPGASVVEIGSYQGRSTIVLALAAGAGVSVVAIDSHDGDNRGPRQVCGMWEQGQADYEAFWENLRRAGVAERVDHLRVRSRDALGRVRGPIDLLYVDGAHQYRAARDDIGRWGARVRGGGTMLVHDGFSSIGVTLALLGELALSDGWSYAGRDGLAGRVPARSGDATVKRYRPRSVVALVHPQPHDQARSAHGPALAEPGARSRRRVALLSVVARSRIWQG